MLEKEKHILVKTALFQTADLHLQIQSYRIGKASIPHGNAVFRFQHTPLNMDCGAAV
jgi:hypothetical protein